MADGGSGSGSGGGRSYNMRNPAVKRIMQEIKEMQKEKCTDYLSMPLEEDIFEWQFAIHGPRDSEFEGGIYHGRITLPADYPFKPPSFMLLTPSGRFEVQTKICLSISNHHPEHWQPSWSVRTALVALIAFMPTKPDGALGSLDFPKEERRALAVKSRLAPPQFGSPERQRLMQQIHEQMLKTAPPVPTKPLPSDSASSPPPKPAPSPAASPASPPPPARPSASAQATADAASAAALPQAAVADSAVAPASAAAGLNAAMSPASSHAPAATAALLPAVAMGCPPHSSSTTSVPGLESSSSQEIAEQSQGETAVSTSDGSSTTPSAAPLGSTPTPTPASSASAAVSPAHTEVTAEQRAAAVQQGHAPVTALRQRVAAGAAGTGGAAGAHRVAAQEVARAPLTARCQPSSSTDRLLSLLAAVIGLAIAVIMWQKMTRIFAGSYLAGSDSEL